MVDHELLLMKLRQIGTGLGGTGLKWFSSYVENRGQYVKPENMVSLLQIISKGVPQGSILGHVLFTIPTSDFARAIHIDVTQLLNHFIYQPISIWLLRREC